MFENDRPNIKQIQQNSIDRVREKRDTRLNTYINSICRNQIYKVYVYIKKQNENEFEEVYLYIYMSNIGI